MLGGIALLPLVQHRGVSWGVVLIPLMEGH